MKAIDCIHDLRVGDFHLNVATQIPVAGVTGVFGRSGAGKTTLLRCIAGLEDSGSDQRPVHLRRIAYVFQTPQLFDHLSVRQNIEYGYRRASEKRVSVDEVVTFLDLQSIQHRMPSTLSGGESQRVAIARAVCQSPTLILMDEPLSALDSERKEELLPYLEKVHRKMPIPFIYVSHQIEEICRLCDHLLVMDEGRVVADGDLQETLTRLDLPQLSGVVAGAVLQAAVRSYDEDFDLTAFEFSGGTIRVPGQFTASSRRLRVLANDVSVTLSEDKTSSILNVLPARIDAVEPEGVATKLLRLQLGDEYLLARITSRSWQQLGLDVGQAVFAQLKSVTVRS